jgi:hypothetical protein
MVLKSWELWFGVCHEKAKCMLGFGERCLFGQSGRAMTTNAKKMLSDDIYLTIEI